MLILVIYSVRVQEDHLINMKTSWDNGMVSHDIYHALLPKLVRL